MRKIRDERLKVRNLENIRIAFAVQTIGILAILGYDLFTKGLEGMRSNPVWFVFMFTAVVFAYLSMSISADQEKQVKSPQKNFIISLLVIAIISIIIGMAASADNKLSGAVVGGIIFICGFLPIWYIYYLRKKQQEDSDD